MDDVKKDFDLTQLSTDINSEISQYYLKKVEMDLSEYRQYVDYINPKEIENDSPLVLSFVEDLKNTCSKHGMQMEDDSPLLLKMIEKFRNKDYIPIAVLKESALKSMIENLTRSFGFEIENYRDHPYVEFNISRDARNAAQLDANNGTSSYKSFFMPPFFQKNKESGISFNRNDEYRMCTEQEAFKLFKDGIEMDYSIKDYVYSVAQSKEYFLALADRAIAQFKTDSKDILFKEHQENEEATIIQARP